MGEKLKPGDEVTYANGATGTVIKTTQKETQSAPHENPQVTVKTKHRA